jgi:hypothetical protein
MFHISQRVLCVGDRIGGENGVFDPTFAERCPNLPVKRRIYTVRGFVVPYAGYPGTLGMLLVENVNPPCPYYEGTFEPSFCRRTFDLGPSAKRHFDIHRSIGVCRDT